MTKNILYANSVVAALSNSLITKECLNRLVEAQNAKTALATLQETNFGSGVSIDSPFEIETLLNFETKKLLKFITQETPSTALEQYFLLQYDYNNIASFCKGLLLEQDTTDFVQAEGNYDWVKIKDLISSKNFKDFNNSYIEKALNEFQDYVGKKEVNGYEVDFLFKKYMFENLKDIVKKDKLLAEIVSLKIDIENISVAMRSSTQYTMDAQKLKNATLSNAVLLKIFNKDSSVLSEIKNPILQKFAKLALSNETENSYVKFEVLKNSFIFDCLKPKKFDVNTIAPFAYYCFQKESEIKNVRLIMSYQCNNLKDKIKERFLEYYGG